VKHGAGPDPFSRSPVFLFLWKDGVSGKGTHTSATRKHTIAGRALARQHRLPNGAGQCASLLAALFVCCADVELVKTGRELVFASPLGGLAPVDPGSVAAFKDDAGARHWRLAEAGVSCWADSR
jgi:hypothetical protein